MIVVLYENSTNIILPFMDKLFKNFPESTRGSVGPRDKQTDLLARYKKPPLFTEGWLLTCSPKVSKGTIVKLTAGTKNCVVIRVTNESQKNEVLQELSDVEVMYVDNYVLPRGEVITWICEELSISASLGDYLYERCNGRIKAITEAVGTLSLIDNITTVTINKYVKRGNTASLSAIVAYMLGLRHGASLRKSILRLIKEYRYASGWLITFLIKQLDSYIVVFQYAMNGELSLANYRQFVKATDDKRITDLGEYRVKNILNAFGSVSLEYVLFVRESLARLNKKDRLSIYRVCQLVELGGQI